VKHVGRGACLSAAKEYDAAKQEYQFAVNQHPHFPFVHYAYGKFLLEARDRAGAIQEFQKEIVEAPSGILPRMQIAATDYKVDSAAGVPYAAEAVRLAPQLPGTHYLLGLLLLDTGDYQKAIPELETAKKAFPKESKIYWSLSVAYAHAGRTQDAAQSRATFAQLSQATDQKSEDSTPGETPDAGPQIDITDGMAASSGH
jgi:predicted Zn-dependent protease